MTEGYNGAINQRQFRLAEPFFPTDFRYPDRTYRDASTSTVGDTTVPGVVYRRISEEWTFNLAGTTSGGVWTGEFECWHTEYAGALAIVTYVTLLVLAVTQGGMYVTQDVSKAFDRDTLRLGSEIPKIIFLGAFSFFMSKMAEFTTGNMRQLAEAETSARANYYELKSMLATIDRTALPASFGAAKPGSASMTIFWPEM